MHYPAPPHPLYYASCSHPFYQQPTCNHHQYTPSIRQQNLEVDPTLFYKSAGAFKKLMKDATVVLNTLAESEEFAYKVMQAAQQNNTEKVENLIESTGVKGTVNVKYNPDGINLEMVSKVENTNCCKLVMAIRWR